jgi:hypothetical protein
MQDVQTPGQIPERSHSVALSANHPVLWTGQRLGWLLGVMGVRVGGGSGGRSSPLINHVAECEHLDNVYGAGDSNSAWIHRNSGRLVLLTSSPGAITWSGARLWPSERSGSG